MWTLAFACAAAVYAHDGMHERIEALSAQIAQRPADAALYIQRGDLWRDHRNWDAALADFERAAALAPRHPQLDTLRARTLHEAGWHASALFFIERRLRAAPDDGPALLLRAAALAGLNRFAEAAPAYRRALTRMDQPQPDHYLAAARACAYAGGDRVADAIAVLDEGLKRLGPIITLERPAVELELRLGRYDAALARIERVLRGLDRQESWLALRGEVLEQADRLAQAADVYQQALAAIEALPANPRRQPATQELEQIVRDALVQLAADREAAQQSARTNPARNPQAAGDVTPPAEANNP